MSEENNEPRKRPFPADDETVTPQHGDPLRDKIVEDDE